MQNATEINVTKIIWHGVWYAKKSRDHGISCFRKRKGRRREKERARMLKTLKCFIVCNIGLTLVSEVSVMEFWRYMHSSSCVLFTSAPRLRAQMFEVWCARCGFGVALFLFPPPPQIDLWKRERWSMLFSRNLFNIVIWPPHSLIICNIVNWSLFWIFITFLHFLKFISLLVAKAL